MERQRAEARGRWEHKDTRVRTTTTTTTHQLPEEGDLKEDSKDGVEEAEEGCGWRMLRLLLLLLLQLRHDGLICCCRATLSAWLLGSGTLCACLRPCWIGRRAETSADEGG